MFVPTGQRFTYAELDRRANACAQLWQQGGIGHGDRVGILSENRPEYVEAFFAAAKTGAILVPLSTRMTAAALELIVRDSGLKCLMYSAQYAAAASELRALADVPHWIDLDERKKLSTDVILSEDATKSERPAFGCEGWCSARTCRYLLEALTAWLAARLGKYKLPREFRFLDELPRTAHGKVVKPELRERYRKEKSASAAT